MKKFLINQKYLLAEMIINERLFYLSVLLLLFSAFIIVTTSIILKLMSHAGMVNWIINTQKFNDLVFTSIVFLLVIPAFSIQVNTMKKAVLKMPEQFLYKSDQENIEKFKHTESMWEKPEGLIIFIKSLRANPIDTIKRVSCIYNYSTYFNPALQQSIR